jgi:RND family efflux transporter MFP subunit
MTHKTKTCLVISLFPVLFTPGCSKEGQAKVEAAEKTKAERPIPVRVAVAETRPLDRAIAVTGSLLPDETVSVSSEVAGRVSDIFVDFGQSVRKGDILAELDKREFNFQHERARAALAQALARIGLDPAQEEAAPESTPAIRQAMAQMEDARFKFENSARLIKTGDISQERYIELEKTFRAREAAYQAALDDLRTQLANIQALRAEVRLAQKRLSDATLLAPFDGAVTARLASPGQYLKENTPMLTVVKPFPLRLRVDIPETAADEVRIGSSLAFTTGAAPGVTFRAVVRELNPALDARSRSLAAEARLSTPDSRLRPGMFVQVQLALSRNASVTVVPKEALYQLAGLTKLFIIRDDRAVESRITPGQEIGGWIEVPGDTVHPGDRIAVTRLGMLIDGARVAMEAAR